MDDKRLGAAPSLNEFEVLEGGKWRAPPVGHAFSRLVLNFNADSDDAAAAAASGSLNLAGDSGVDSNSEESEKEKKVKWPYLSDEEIFASFSTKRKYEREWRHKKKKKGGKKHKKNGYCKRRRPLFGRRAEQHAFGRKNAFFLRVQQLWSQSSGLGIQN